VPLGHRASAFLNVKDGDTKKMTDIIDNIIKINFRVFRELGIENATTTFNALFADIMVFDKCSS
jgi:hypothetical protein